MLQRTLRKPTVKPAIASKPNPHRKQLTPHPSESFVTVGQLIKIAHQRGSTLDATRFYHQLKTNALIPDARQNHARQNRRHFLFATEKIDQWIQTAPKRAPR